MFDITKFHQSLHSSGALSILKKETFFKHSDFKSEDTLALMYHSSHQKLYQEVFDILISLGEDPYQYLLWYYKKTDKGHTKTLDWVLDSLENKTNKLSQEEITFLLKYKYTNRDYFKLLDLNYHIEDFEQRKLNAQEIIKDISHDHQNTPLKTQAIILEQYRKIGGEDKEIEQYVSDMLKDNKFILKEQLIQTVLIINSLEISKSTLMNLDEIHWSIKEMYTPFQAFVKRYNLYSYMTLEPDNNKFIHKIFISSDNQDNLNKIENFVSFLINKITQDAAIIDLFSINPKVKVVPNTQQAIHKLFSSLWMECSLPEDDSNAKKIKVVKI